MTTGATVGWLLAGAVGAVALIAAGRRVGEQRAFGAGLIVTAAIYVGFALAGPGRALAIEAAGLTGYGALAVAGLRGRPRWLALGWALHPAWDIGLHLSGVQAIAPDGYALLCLGFDPVIAGWILARPADGTPAGDRLAP